MPQIRRSLGVCPQQNVLFPDLTVWEHMILYAGIKGVAQKGSIAHERAKQLLEDVGLIGKETSLPDELSGGQKRKLCLAIALTGDSRVVFLDEPTSGMDVYAQRSTWSLLKKRRTGRLLVLTTHSMEEAERLGDRIGIMANGKAVCVEREKISRPRPARRTARGD